MNLRELFDRRDAAQNDIDNVVNASLAKLQAAGIQAPIGNNYTIIGIEIADSDISINYEYYRCGHATDSIEYPLKLIENPTDEAIANYKAKLDEAERVHEQNRLAEQRDTELRQLEFLRKKFGL